MRYINYVKCMSVLILFSALSFPLVPWLCLGTKKAGEPQVNHGNMINVGY